MRPLAFLVLVLICFACGGGEPTAATDAPLTADDIIRTAIERNGLADFDSTAVSFRFRDKRYRYQRLNGRFAYERWWTDTTDGSRIRDVLTNDTLVRYVDDAPVALDPKRRRAYGNSVNSVVYFAFLPWALADPGVRATYVGPDTIRGESLHHLTVGFATHGAEDHADDYEYWFDPTTYDIRYLAYSEPGGKAPRFREAYNSRTVDGIRVRDYRNYTTADKSNLRVDGLAALYETDSLRLLSVIEHDEFRREAVVNSGATRE